MNIGDIVNVPKSSKLSPGQGKFVKLQYVKKRVSAIDNGWFAVERIKTRDWYKIAD